MQHSRAREAILGLGQAYHPVALASGKRQSAAKVADELERHFDEVELVPAAYLDRLADKARSRQVREQLRDTAARLRREAYEAMTSSGEMARLQRADVVEIVRECAESKWAVSEQIASPRARISRRAPAFAHRRHARSASPP